MAAAERPERGERQFAQPPREGRGKVGGDRDGCPDAVFGIVVVEARVEKEFAGRGGDRDAVLVFEHPDLDLASVDQGFKEEQTVGLLRRFDQSDQFRPVPGAARPDRTARARRLDENRVAERPLDASDRVGRIFDGLREPARDRDPGGGEKGLAERLVHRDGAGFNARARVGEREAVQKTLQPTVLGRTAVNGRENARKREKPPTIAKQNATRHEIGRGKQRRIVPERAVSDRPGVAPIQPRFPVAVQIDREAGDTLPVEFRDDRGGGEKRDVVFVAFAAEQDAENRSRHSRPRRKNSACAVLLFYAGSGGTVQGRERIASRGLPP